MATFTQMASGNWRVQVRRKTRYVAETFRRRKDGEEWALEMERNIDRNGSSKPRVARNVRTFARGQRRRHWNKRLLTQPGDRELMTRHETQLRCPELLITNYSMLEYMLMRPIERPIFQQGDVPVDVEIGGQALLTLSL